MWFRVDDKLWGSPKWLALKPSARALWVSAGSYSMDQLTDGVVDRHVIAILGGKASDAKALVDARLWENHERGYVFHDWADYQPSREDVLGKREAEAQRKAEWRAKRAAQRAASDERPTDVPAGHERDNRVSPAAVPNVSRSSRPDPTRPDPTSPKGEVTTAPPDGGGASAATLIAEWIDHCDARPPSRVIGQLSKEIKTLLTEGTPYGEVRDAVATWHTKGLHPSTLASVVHENRATKKPTRATGTTRALTTLEIAARYEEQEGAGNAAQPGRQIAG